MKIDLSRIDKEIFAVKEVKIGGEDCYFVTPIGNPEWTADSLIYRSSIWNKNGEPISLGFPKFFNAHERNDLKPLPSSLSNCSYIEKKDGSCIILSKYNGKHIVRTRGCLTPESVMENGRELEIFRKTIVSELEKQFPEPTWNFSLLFEWLSPTYTVVIENKCLNFVLIGCIDHHDYSLLTQEGLDYIALRFDFDRPERYKFDSLDTLIGTVKDWKNKEGIVLYSNNDQTLHKFKSDDYLLKHRFKSNATLANTLDLYFKYDCPPKEEFRKKIGQDFDFECLGMVEKFILQIYQAEYNAKHTLETWKFWCAENKDLSQKEFAIKLLADNKDMAWLVFGLRKLGKCGKMDYRKLMDKMLNL